MSGDRDPKISSARTTLHAAWAICSRAVSVAFAQARLREVRAVIQLSVAVAVMTHEYEKKI